MPSPTQPPSHMVTIHDVAVRAGVSATTVSHVINGTRNVSPLLSQRVRAAMLELGYQPNDLARSLRRKQSHTIGLVVPDNSNPFFAEMARGLEDSAYASNYTVFLCNTDGDTDREAFYIDMLLKRQVDGIVLVAAGDNNEFIKPLSARGLPVVVVDRDIPGAAVDAVFTDHEAGGFAATTHLIRLGHRRIACISGPSALAPSAGRVEGYINALRAAGLPVDPSLIVRGGFTAQTGQDCLSQLLQRPGTPTAVFVCNDLMAMGAMAAARSAGLTIPDDLSIVGYDNIRFAALLNPPLTTIAQPTYDLGKAAAALLLQRLEDRTLPPRRVLLSTGLVVRESTCPPRLEA